jgi:hypothetical protein
MKIHYFTSEHFALKNLERQHLKISFSTEVNDLFELKPFEFGERKIRKVWQQAINEHAKTQRFHLFFGFMECADNVGSLCKQSQGTLLRI